MTKILVVDDNTNNRLTIELLLEDFEVEILSAENGKEAVEIAKSSSPSLIFMDLMMPEMDGIEATKLIREFDKTTMIVAVTALDDSRSKDQMLKFGAEDYIRKPIAPDVFTRRVKNYLEIIALRKERGLRKNSHAKNLFDDKVFNRSCTFRVADKDALAEFWEYFLASDQKNIDSLVDSVRVIYAFGSWLLKTKIEEFFIIIEENNDYIYITLENLSTISSVVIRNILLKNYPDGKYKLDSDKLSISLKKSEPDQVKQLSSDEETVLRKTHANDKISASDFVANTAISLIYKIDKLEELEFEIDSSIINFENRPSKDQLLEISLKVRQYNEVIDALFEFQHLAFAINSLVELLERLEETQLTEPNRKKMGLLLTNILQDLSSWRRTIFVEQATDNIHYLDSSLLSSCLQFEMIFEEKKIGSDDDDDDIEFF